MPFIPTSFRRDQIGYAGDATKLFLTFLFSDRNFGIQLLQDVELIPRKVQCNVMSGCSLPAVDGIYLLMYARAIIPRLRYFHHVTLFDSEHLRYSLRLCAKRRNNYLVTCADSSSIQLVMCAKSRIYFLLTCADSSPNYLLMCAKSRVYYLVMCRQQSYQLVMFANSRLYYLVTCADSCNMC